MQPPNTYILIAQRHIKRRSAILFLLIIVTFSQANTFAIYYINGWDYVYHNCINEVAKLVHAERKTKTCFEFLRAIPFFKSTSMLFPIKSFLSKRQKPHYTIAWLLYSSVLISFTQSSSPIQTCGRAYSGREGLSMYRLAPQNGGVRIRGNSPRHGIHPYPSCLHRQREYVHWRYA